MKVSARNQLKGKIVKLTEGAVNTEVVIEIASGQQITSVVTKASAQNLGLAIAKEAYAIIKASEVMIGTE